MRTDANQLLARQLSFNLERPLLFTEEVRKITGFSSANIRTLFTRGHLRLDYTPSAGRGVRVQYPMFDVIEIMAYSELSRLGVHPTFTGAWKDGRPIAIGIANCVFDQIRAIAGDTTPRKRAREDGNFEEILPGSEKFVIVYYDCGINGVWAIWSPDALCKIPETGMARVVIDCEALALCSLDIFAQYKNRI